jgi:hypothetical protein
MVVALLPPVDARAGTAATSNARYMQIKIASSNAFAQGTVGVRLSHFNFTTQRYWTAWLLGNSVQTGGCKGRIQAM